MKLKLLHYSTSCWSFLLLVVFVREFHITFADNLAYNQPSTQGGTYNSQPQGLAVDNDSTNTCAFSNNGPGEPPAWWQVDLQYECYITSVTIQFPNANDCQYAQDFVIVVSDNNSTSSSTPVCYTFSNGSVTGSGDTVTLRGLRPTFTCIQPLTGRYVTIRRQEGYQNRSMSFCDVQVNGFVLGSEHDGNRPAVPNAMPSTSTSSPTTTSSTTTTTIIPISTSRTSTTTVNTVASITPIPAPSSPSSASTTPTSTSQYSTTNGTVAGIPSSSSEGSINTGLIVGVVIGGVFLIIILVLLIIIVVCRKKAVAVPSSVVNTNNNSKVTTDDKTSIYTSLTPVVNRLTEYPPYEELKLKPIYVNSI